MFKIILRTVITSITRQF